MAGRRARETAVVIPCGAEALAGTLTLPEAAGGLVLFAHGSGSGQRSLRNRHVAAVLVDGGLATLLLDLLTADLAMLGHQMVAAVDWSAGQPSLEQLPLGLHGSSTGAAAVLQAAAIRPDRVRSVVCRSGRPDLAFSALGLVRCPTLLIVGGRDRDVLALNRWAASRLAGPHQLAVVPGASHLFGEAGTLQTAAELSWRWLQETLLQQPGGAGADPEFPAGETSVGGLAPSGRGASGRGASSDPD